MENCPICFDTKPLITLHQSCSFCADCIFSWLKTLVLNKSINSESQATCPTQGCLLKQAVLSITTSLPREYIEQLNDAYLKNYLIDKADVFHCPNQICEYSGFYNASQFGCKVPFHCESCNSEWTNPLIRGSSDTICQKLRTFMTKEFSSKRCPNCGTYITLYAGCPMVTCTSCQTRFSWYRVFHRGWLVLYFLLGIPIFLLLTHFYENMVVYARNHWYTSLGMWILHIILIHIWLKFFLHYMSITNHHITKMTAGRFAHLVLRVFSLTIPIGSLIWLNSAWSGYYKYWLVIGGIELGLLIAFLIFAFTMHILARRRPRRRPELHVRPPEINASLIRTQ